MGKRPLRHHSFILTLWLETAERPTWRLSLEDPHTGIRQGFKEIQELAQFLEAWTAVPPTEDLTVE